MGNMSAQQDTTESTAPAQPSLCKMGCGFFGSNATGDCCSKCWGQLQASQQQVEKCTEISKEAIDPTKEQKKPTTEKEIKITQETKTEEPATTPVKKTKKKKKKKKKKTTKKKMKSGMVNGSGKTNVDK